MIYAVGHREVYGKLLADAALAGKPVRKLGKGVDQEGLPYAGGTVWQTAAAAAAHLARRGLDHYAVYELDADWAADTEQLVGEPYRRLLRNAVILGRAAVMA